MKPVSLSEKLMYNTVKLQTANSSGTGFFYHFDVDGSVYPVIVTNKHVVNNKLVETVSFSLHLRNGEGEANENIKLSFETAWIPHPTQDLCFCFVKQLFDKVKNMTGKEIYYIAIPQSIHATQEKLESLSALEQVTMVGYPDGLLDKKNNFPIFRRGYTASHPAIDFNESGIGLVDMACFPGSSGSPIFILNEGSYTEKNGTVNIANRIIFLGVLFSGPTLDANGKITIEKIPTQYSLGVSTPVMINLGFYIKSAELNAFNELIKNIIEKSPLGEKKE